METYSSDVKLANSKLKDVVGKKVSASLNAYGYVLYLEFGELVTTEEVFPNRKKYKSTKGEITVSFDGNWRFIKDSNLEINSIYHNRQEIDQFLPQLNGSIVKAIEVNKNNFVTTVQLDNQISLVIFPNLRHNDNGIWAITQRGSKDWFTFRIEDPDKYFDLVDSKDQITGVSTAKQCHSNADLIHRVCHFTLIDTQLEKVLITQRSSKVKYDSGLWCFMGEHVLAGFSYGDAVSDGLKDELGISETSWGEHANNVFKYENQSEFTRFFLVYYEGEKLKPNPAEIDEYRWISIQELKENKKDYSKATQYWIDAIDWKAVMKQYEWIKY